MTEDNKSKKPPRVDLSKPDSLQHLDQETLIGIVNSLYDQNRQLSELLQQFLREEYGRKTERFVDSGGEAKTVWLSTKRSISSNLRQH